MPTVLAPFIRCATAPALLPLQHVWASCVLPWELSNLCSQPCPQPACQLCKWSSLCVTRAGAYLQGVSGAGKTTLMDVLAGRKTGQHFILYQHSAGDLKIRWGCWGWDMLGMQLCSVHVHERCLCLGLCCIVCQCYVFDARHL